MLLQTSLEQKAADSAYVTSGGDIFDLIMSAGTSLAETAATTACGIHSGKSKTTPESAAIVIVCGSGNNGCDGLAAAYELARKGFSPRVYTVCPNRDSNKSSARARLEKLLEEHAQVTVNTAFDADPDAEPAASFISDLSSADVVLDCVFGSGFDVSRPLSPGISSVFDDINRSAATVISADVPSGVSADTGETVENPVKADVTVAFSGAKPGHFILPGKAFCGRVTVADIPLLHKLSSVSGTREAFTPQDLETVKKLLPVRNPYGHKYSNGRVLVVAGSKRFCGAAILAVSSSLRSGAGLVTSAVPGAIIDAVTVACPEAVRLPLGDRFSETLTPAHVPAVLAEAAESTAVVIGPGLGRDVQTLEAVREIIASPEVRRVVVDADALFAVSPLDGTAKDMFKNKSVVLTPHEAEAARLAGTGTAEILRHRLAYATEISKITGAVTVLKGSGTITLSGPDNFTVNSTGNSSLSKGGSGDVLSGLAGALLAQACNPYDAARAAVFIHGLAAEKLSAKYSEFCVLPGDLPVAFSEILC